MGRTRSSPIGRSATKDRLAKRHDEAGSIDVVLASNMISVGVDIDRLGLMVVAGQPKAASEYIQATSRVGRRSDRPGLVVTCFNLHRPRDRSHYESFVAFHRAFYRYVEPTSLTPFSLPAMMRGYAGALMAMLRHAEPSLMPGGAVGGVPGRRAELAEPALEALARRAPATLADATAGDALEASVRARGKRLMDDLQQLIESAHEGAAQRKWSELDRGIEGRAIMRPDRDEAGDALEERFIAPMSMRDVEPSAHIWVFRKRQRSGAG